MALVNGDDCTKNGESHLGWSWFVITKKHACEVILFDWKSEIQGSFYNYSEIVTMSRLSPFFCRFGNPTAPSSPRALLSGVHFANCPAARTGRRPLLNSYRSGSMLFDSYRLYRRQWVVSAMVGKGLEEIEYQKKTFYMMFHNPVAASIVHYV